MHHTLTHFKLKFVKNPYFLQCEKVDWKRNFPQLVYLKSFIHTDLPPRLNLRHPISCKHNIE